MSPRGWLRPKSGGSFQVRFESHSTPMKMRRQASASGVRSRGRTTRFRAPSTTTSPGDPLTDVEPQRSGDGALESAEPAPPPHLDLVAPGDDVALDGGRQAGGQRERERVP